MGFQVTIYEVIVLIGTFKVSVYLRRDSQIHIFKIEANFS